ncbi:AAC(3) family N-acetyltransferase [Kribbella sancticallisti]|uniref:Aminoglycoside N(3)-acetyltransferase n=1 Tax=Kribbella sancticallisti TaxID=460087 RepID=A0ABP4PSY5_9ACTN
MDETMPNEVVTQARIVAGLEQLGLTRQSAVIVHSSLRSFGHVDGGAEAVGRALVEACGTVMVPAGTWDLSGVDPPPGLRRPMNAYEPSPSWAAFEEQLDRAKPFSPDLPADRELGIIPETLRLTQPHQRSTHPVFSYVAAGAAAEQVVGAQRLDWPLGPIEKLAQLDGVVLLLGVTHTANTTIHLAEQQLGRSTFYRYAKVDGSWLELPNIPGASHRFDAIEPDLLPHTREILIGSCRARAIPIRAVLAATHARILADPRALLCSDDPACRCAAAYEQRLVAEQCTGSAGGLEV